MGGGGTGGGGPNSPGCGFIDALADDFEDDPLGNKHWDDDWGDGGLVANVDGNLVFQFDDSYSYAYRYTQFGYDATGRSIGIEVVDASITSEHWFWFDVGPGSDDYVEIGLDGDELIIAVELDDNFLEIAPRVPFDIDQHRYWRFREDEGTIHYEVSGDAETWTELAAQSVSALGGWEHVGISLGGDGDGGASGYVSVAGITADGESDMCTTASFQDDFDDQDAGSFWEWGYQDGDCDVDEQNGLVRFFAPSDAVSDECARGTTRAFDLTGSSITLEVVTPDSNVGFYFGVTDAWSDNEYGWDIDQGHVYAYFEVDESDFLAGDFSYDATNMRWIRIREEDGTVYWEGSPDGQTFTEYASTPVLIDLTVLRVVAGIYTSSSHSVDSLVEVDNYNLAPGGP